MFKPGNAQPEVFCTLEEVGKELGLTRERSRQIQLIALHKLREGLEKRGYKLSDLI